MIFRHYLSIGAMATKRKELCVLCHLHLPVKKIIGGMNDRCSRCKCVAEEYERCGGKNADDCGKGNFYDARKDYVKIGGK